MRSLLLTLSLCTASAWAATYRASSDAEINALAAKLKPGDVLEIARGDYRGQFTLRNSGTPDQPITVRGIDRPVLTGAGSVVHGAVVRFQGDHTVFENFEITSQRDPNTWRGLYVVANDITIRDCVVHDVAGQGVQGSDSGGSITLERVEIYRCGAGDKAHQIYVGTSNDRYPNAVFRVQNCYLHGGLGGNNVKSRAGRTEIYGNWIEGAAAHELDLIGADPSGQKPGTAAAVREDADVVGNLFRKRAGSIGYFARLGTDGTGASDGRYRFAYNTFVTDPDVRGNSSIFGAKAAVQALEVYNNVFYSPTARLRVVYGIDFGITIGAGNWCSTQTTNVPPTWATRTGDDPGFDDAAKLRFGLRSGSPLIGGAVKKLPELSGLEFPKPRAVVATQPARAAKVGGAKSPGDVGAF